MSLGIQVCSAQGMINKKRALPDAMTHHSPHDHDYGVEFGGIYACKVLERWQKLV